MKRATEIKYGDTFRIDDNSHVYVKGNYIDGYYLCYQYHHPRNEDLAKLIHPDKMILPVIGKNGVFENQ